MMGRVFDEYVGVDYSGAGEHDARLTGLQVYRSEGASEPVWIGPPTGRSWSRELVEEWLRERLATGRRLVVGLDHGFSFPRAFCSDRQWHSWRDVLAATVARFGNDRIRLGLTADYAPDPFDTMPRRTDRWTSSAKPVLGFHLKQGSVACSTHAGMVRLHSLLQRAPRSVHVWPFSGWDLPETGSMVCEVYPSILRRRYDHPASRPSVDERDAYAIARWLSEVDVRGLWDHYLHPPLMEEERTDALIEGWILGVT